MEFQETYTKPIIGLSRLGLLFVLMLVMQPSMLNAQRPPKVSSSVDTTSIKIGEQIAWTVSVEIDTTDQVVFPEGQTFSPLETVEAYATDSTKKDDRLTLIKKYALTQFDSGNYKLPAQRIDINGIGYMTDSLRITVATVPVDTLNQKMYDIKPLLQVDGPLNKFWTYMLIGLLVFALIGGLVYWFFLRKKPLTQVEKEALLPPYDRAMLELKRLENSKYLIKDEYKAYYSELTDIVRSYLEEDAQVDAMESTTDEIIQKLQLLSDGGRLGLDRDTINQFKNILQTADLVKFAKSKPPLQTAEQDRAIVEELVRTTHEAIPQPTEEELQEQAEYQEEMARKAQRRKWIIATRAAGVLGLLAMGIFAYQYGFTRLKDTLLRNPTKILLEQEWAASSYGYPPIILETPEILERQNIKIPPNAAAEIQDMQAFVYRNEQSLFTIGATALTLAQEKEPDFAQTLDQILKSFEAQGAKNIITKQEEFTTISGVKGLRVFGSGKFAVPNSGELQGGKYTVLLFGGKGFQQYVILTWPEEDPYGQDIADRILTTVEVKTTL